MLTIQVFEYMYLCEWLFNLWQLHEHHELASCRNRCTYLFERPHTKKFLSIEVSFLLPLLLYRWRFAAKWARNKGGDGVTRRRSNVAFHVSYKVCAFPSRLCARTEAPQGKECGVEPSGLQPQWGATLNRRTRGYRSKGEQHDIGWRAGSYWPIPIARGRQPRGASWKSLR